MKYKGKYIKDDGGRSKYFKGQTGDCVIRACAIALNQDYKETMKELFDLAFNIGCMPNDNDVWKPYLASKGFVRHSTPKDKKGKKISIRNWSAECPSVPIVVLTREHLVAVVGNVQRDIWLDERTVSSYYMKGVE